MGDCDVREAREKKHSKPEGLRLPGGWRLSAGSPCLPTLASSPLCLLLRPVGRRGVQPGAEGRVQEAVGHVGSCCEMTEFRPGFLALGSTAAAPLPPGALHSPAATASGDRCPAALLELSSLLQQQGHKVWIAQPHVVHPTWEEVSVAFFCPHERHSQSLHMGLAVTEQGSSCVCVCVCVLSFVFSGGKDCRRLLCSLCGTQCLSC